MDRFESERILGSRSNERNYVKILKEDPAVADVMDHEEDIKYFLTSESQLVNAIYVTTKISESTLPRIERSNIHYTSPPSTRRQQSGDVSIEDFFSGRAGVALTRKRGATYRYLSSVSRVIMVTNEGAAYTTVG